MLFFPTSCKSMESKLFQDFLSCRKLASATCHGYNDHLTCVNVLTARFRLVSGYCNDEPWAAEPLRQNFSTTNAARTILSLAPCARHDHISSFRIIYVVMSSFFSLVDGVMLLHIRAANNFSCLDSIHRVWRE